jgi:predicted transposase YbfD/YdcC
VREKESELKTANNLVENLPITGKVVTGDALYCERGFCKRVLKARGDYLVIVKDNQPELRKAIELVFPRPVVSEE